MKENLMGSSKTIKKQSEFVNFRQAQASILTEKIFTSELRKVSVSSLVENTIFSIINLRKIDSSALIQSASSSTINLRNVNTSGLIQTDSIVGLRNIKLSYLEQIEHDSNLSSIRISTLIGSQSWPS